LFVIRFLPEDCEIGQLFVGGFETAFATIKINKTLRKLNGKIIECKWENGQWKFMRERTDKSYPNALKTAVSVCDSIKFPVTEEMLFSLIDQVEMVRRMPPPISNKVIK
jgi:mRNA-capping enzyme